MSVSSGKSYTDVIIHSRNYGFYYYDDYRYAYNYVCYKFNASSAGKLTADIKTSVNEISIIAFGADNSVMLPSDITKPKNGNITPAVPYSVVTTTGSIQVSVTFDVKKGTNYMFIFGSQEYSYNDYTATTKFTFKANSSSDSSVKKPAKTTLIANKASGGFKLSWMAVEGITKYQIQYSEDGGKTFKTAGKVAKSKTSCTLKLDTSKSYVFRIRSYKTVNGKKYYSKWSNKVKV